MLGLAIIILSVILILGLVGHAFPSPPHSSPRPMGVPSTDLRVSEFAPDLKVALGSVPSAEEEYNRAYIEQRVRTIEYNEALGRDYHERLLAAKAKRWAEGNPVTREHPLLDHEKPYEPTYL